MKIDQIEDFPDAKFEVTIISLNNTVHLVHLDEDYYSKLTANRIEPKELIQRSFDFLLERESNTSILSEFDLRKIKEYYPEFEDQIQNSIEL